MLDIAKSFNTVVASDSGFELELRSPVPPREALGLFITVLGKDSREYRTVLSDQAKKRVARMTKGGGSRNAGSITPEDVEREGIDVLASATKGWRQSEDGVTKDTLTLDGKEISFSREAVIALYTDYPWIKEQVDEAVHDRANFIQR